MSVSVAVAGASGYAGGEIVRLLANHPEFDLVTVTGHQNAGQKLRSIHRHLRSIPDLELKQTTSENLNGHDLVFVALPHGESAAITAGLDAAKIVDCGADHRLESAPDWARFYGGEHAEPWVYGLPELPLAGGKKQRELLTGTTRIAVPGCNVTAVTLALAPGIAAGLIDPLDINAVLAVGTSGAGRSSKPELSASEILGSAKAYSVGGVHRHIPEIQQNFRRAGASEVTISFTPVLVPMSRGILATVTAKLSRKSNIEEILAVWNSTFGQEPFVELLDNGEFPTVADVVGSNLARIGLAIDKSTERLVALCAIDNLVKGTAGAAIQSANLAFGFDEQMGLSRIGVAP